MVVELLRIIDRIQINLIKDVYSARVLKFNVSSDHGS